MSALLAQTIRHHGASEVVTQDTCGASMAALATFNACKPAQETIAFIQSKYLNNRVGQD